MSFLTLSNLFFLSSFFYTEEPFIAPIFYPYEYDPSPRDFVHHFLVAYAVVTYEMTWAEADHLIRDSFDTRLQMDRPGYWLTQMFNDDVFLFKMYKDSAAPDSMAHFESMIIGPNVNLDFNTYFNFTNFFDLNNLLSTVTNNYFLLGLLFFMCVFIFLQIFFICDVLLLFIVMDLALSIFAVLFALTGYYTGDFFVISFFFILLTLAACETAISLGFLVSFSRRHQSTSLTLNSLRYAVI